MEKIAILILAHKNPLQVLLFISQFNPTLFDIYVHFDKKLSLTDDALAKFTAYQNVYLVPDEQRISISWGDSTRIKAEKVLLDSSYQKSKYSFFVLCSGQDLLIKKSTRLYDFLTANKGNSFNEAIDDTLIPEFKKRNELKYAKFRTSKSFVSKAARNVYKRITGGVKYTFPLFRTHFSKQFDFHFGSSWFEFNRETVDYIQQFEAKHPHYREGFKKSLNPDECYYQTILFTSKEQVSRLINRNLTYIDWSENGSSPKTLTTDDLKALDASDCFFARKFDETVDSKVIQQILENTK